jgi:hypothetical protein
MEYDDLSAEQQEQVLRRFWYSNPYNYVYELGLDGSVLSRRRKRRGQA